MAYDNIKQFLNIIRLFTHTFSKNCNIGSDRLLATYLSGKICPLTPSQQPTNIEHLAVSSVPTSANLNLKGVATNDFVKQVQSRDEPKQIPSNRPTKDHISGSENTGLNEKPKESLPGMNLGDIDSGGYCQIM